MMFLGLAAVGCGSEAPPASASANTLHDTSKFSSEKLNAPLSSKARTSGAQVAPPPMR